MSTIRLFLALVSAPAVATSPRADQDGAIAWACTYESARNNVSVSLGRYLSNTGRQKEISGDWGIHGASKLRLSGLLWSAAGDPAPRTWSANLGWLYEDYEKDRDSHPAIIVSGLAVKANRPTTELSMPWIDAKKLARNGRVSARLVAPSGQVLKSGFIDAGDIRLAETLVQQALASTRRDAQDFRRRCMRFNPVPVPAR